MKIKTKDLWCSAFVMAKGGELDEIQVDRNGGNKKEVIFILCGPDVTELSREFRSGQALCSVVRLRASMIHLKEQMFARVRAVTGNQ